MVYLSLAYPVSIHKLKSGIFWRWAIGARDCRSLGNFPQGQEACPSRWWGPLPEESSQECRTTAWGGPGGVVAAGAGQAARLGRESSCRNGRMARGGLGGFVGLVVDREVQLRHVRGRSRQPRDAALVPCCCSPTAPPHSASPPSPNATARDFWSSGPQPQHEGCGRMVAAAYTAVGGHRREKGKTWSRATVRLLVRRERREREGKPAGRRRTDGRKLGADGRRWLQGTTYQKLLNLRSF